MKPTPIFNPCSVCPSAKTLRVSRVCWRRYCSSCWFRTLPDWKRSTATGRHTLAFSRDTNPVGGRVSNGLPHALPGPPATLVTSSASSLCFLSDLKVEERCQPRHSTGFFPYIFFILMGLKAPAGVLTSTPCGSIFLPPRSVRGICSAVICRVDCIDIYWSYYCCTNELLSNFLELIDCTSPVRLPSQAKIRWCWVLGVHSPTEEESAGRRMDNNPIYVKDD